MLAGVALVALTDYISQKTVSTVAGHVLILAATLDLFRRAVVRSRNDSRRRIAFSITSVAVVVMGLAELAEHRSLRLSEQAVAILLFLSAAVRVPRRFFDHRTSER
jgi:hypothetical protein